MVDTDQFAVFKQGAEARLYTGTFLGREVVVKERFSKKYRHPALDTQLTRDRHRAEARALVKCRQVGVRCPAMLLCDQVTSTIVMENLAPASTAKLHIDTLLGRLQTEAGEAEARAGLVTLARTIGATVARLHAAGLIHGDITTSNILVDTSKQELELVMIDFGLSFQEGSAEDKGVDLYVLERALLSTHPDTEWMFREICAGYTEAAGGAARAKEVMAKFEEIRLRGRKRTMVG